MPHQGLEPQTNRLKLRMDTGLLLTRADPALHRRRSNASRELVGQAVLLTGLTAKGELNGRRGVALS